MDCKRLCCFRSNDKYNYSDYTSHLSSSSICLHIPFVVHTPASSSLLLYSFTELSSLILSALNSDERFVHCILSSRDILVLKKCCEITKCGVNFTHCEDYLNERWCELWSQMEDDVKHDKTQTETSQLGQTMMYDTMISESLWSHIMM